MNRNVLVVNGNPKSNSFCHELASQYMKSSEQDNNVRFISISNLKFDLDLNIGYDGKQELEPDLIHFQQSVIWAEHVVFVLPVWWGGMPAKLKGLIDRAFLPGFAFKYHDNKSTPEKLLKNRSADIILTMDAPPFYHRWIQGDPVYKQFKRTILRFCGFKKVSATYIGSIINSSEKQRNHWIEEIGRLAKKGGV